MFKTVKSPWVALTAWAALAVCGAANAAEPTPHQIYEALQSGQVVQAQQMVDEVLRNHPGNAKAHYIAAEVAAKSGDLAAGRKQLSQARELDPKLSFVNAQSVTELTAQLSGSSRLRATSQERAEMSAPALGASQRKRGSMLWPLVLIGGVVLVWMLFRRRQQQEAAYNGGQFYGGQDLQPGGPVPGPGPGFGPGLSNYGGYPPASPYPPQSNGMGRTLMGGLATGLAVGAGVAAGEALVGSVLGNHERGSEGNSPVPESHDQPHNQDMGGRDFGLSDGGGWGSDSGDSGGGWGDDSGGGSDGGDWS